MNNPSIVKNIILTLAGMICVLGGVTLVFREWANLIIVFKGMIGGTLAVAGLFMLFLVSGKSTKQ
jgi:hypothetical protein